jgi:hypothetical protein
MASVLTAAIRSHAWYQAAIPGSRSALENTIHVV